MSIYFYVYMPTNSGGRSEFNREFAGLQTHLKIIFLNQLVRVHSQKETYQLYSRIGSSRLTELVAVFKSNPFH
jgi:hypothetical protein